MGAVLMMRQPVSDNGLAGYAMFASILMLTVGIGLVVATLREKNPQSTTPAAPAAPSK
jgi:hypothetical protein